MFEDHYGGCLRNKDFWTNTNYTRSKAVYLYDLLRPTPQSLGKAVQTVDKATELLPENLRPHRLTLNLTYSINDIFCQSKKDSFKPTVTQISVTLFYNLRYEKNVHGLYMNV